MIARIRALSGLFVLLASLTTTVPVSSHALAAGSDPDAGEKSAARLWSEQCGHCHNKRSPEKFSDAQWDVIVHHMRVRANLTGKEAREIVEFLKSAN